MNSTATMESAFPWTRGNADLQHRQKHIPNISRCDGRNDCGDASEEAKCNKIEVLDSYQNEVPPLPLKGESIAKVHIGLNVSAIVEISEVNSIFMVQFAMNLRWREAQLSFRNLKEDRFLNTVSTEDAGKIWFPTILFFNTRYKEMTVVTFRSVCLMRFRLTDT